MSDHWDVYFAFFDDRPGTVVVDLGLHDEAPIAGLSEAVHLRLTLRQPRDDGLSSQEESERLGAVEDALTAALAGAGAPVVFVGRATSHGFRDFHFYTSQAQAAERCLSRAMVPFPEYTFELGTRSDPGWDLYFNVLYPSPAQLQTIQNHQVLKVLQENGDCPEVAREVAHWIDFPSAEARDRFLARAVDAGFREVSRSDEGDGEWPCRLTVSSVTTVDLGTIDDLVLSLYVLAEECEGHYDGWETSVEKSDGA